MEAKVKALARIAVVTVTLAALVAGAPAAGADTTWTKISTDYNANIAIPSLGLTGTTAVVAWTQQTGPFTADLDAVSFTTSPTQDVIGARSHEGPRRAGRRSTTPTRSSRLPAAASQLIFNGIHSTDHRRPADRHGHDAPQRRRQLGGALRRLGLELRPDDRRALGRHPARRGLRHAGHRDLQRGRGPRAGSVRSQPAAPDRRLLRLLAADGARQRRPSLDRVVLERHGRHGHVPAAARPRRRARRSEPLRWRPTARAATTTASARTSPARPPAASSTATRRRPAPPTRSSPGGRARRADHDRQPGQHRAGRRARARPTAYRADGRLWVAWFDGKTYRATLGDADRRGRRGTGCGRAQGPEAGAYALSASPSATTSCWQRTTAGTRPAPCRSRSS